MIVPLFFISVVISVLKVEFKVGLVSLKSNLFSNKIFGLWGSTCGHLWADGLFFGLDWHGMALFQFRDFVRLRSD